MTTNKHQNQPHVQSIAAGLMLRTPARGRTSLVLSVGRRMGAPLKPEEMAQWAGRTMSEVAKRHVWQRSSSHVVITPPKDGMMALRVTWRLLLRSAQRAAS